MITEDNNDPPHLLVVRDELAALLKPGLAVRQTGEVDTSQVRSLHGGVGGQQPQVAQGDPVRPGRELVVRQERLQPAEDLLQVVELVLARLVATLEHHGVDALSIGLVRSGQVRSVIMIIVVLHSQTDRLVLTNTLKLKL